MFETTKANKGLVIYAKFDVIEYTITYHLNGGEIENTNPNTYNIESKTIILNNPTKDNYIFAGWVDSNGLVITKINQGTYGNISLNATWTTEGYSITYLLDGGINSENNPSSYDFFSDEIILEDASKVGYIFTGWTDEAGNVVESVDPTNMRNITYIAEWDIINYTILYELNGSTNSSNNNETYNVTEPTKTLSNPTKDYYVFVNWTDQDDNEITQIVQGTIGDLILTANFVPEEFTIFYNLNGENNSASNPSTYTIESEDIILEEASKDGRDFHSWRKNGVEFTTITKGSTGDITVEAIFSVYVIIVNWGFKETGVHGTFGQPVGSFVEETFEDNRVEGYYLDKALTNRVDVHHMVPDTQTTVYVKWTKGKTTAVHFEEHLANILNTSSTDETLKYVMYNDLNLRNKGNSNKLFYGHLDGNNHTLTVNQKLMAENHGIIENLVINTPETFTFDYQNRIGIFGQYNYGTIRNIKFLNTIKYKVTIIAVSNDLSAGILVSTNAQTGIIEDIIFDGSIDFTLSSVYGVNAGIVSGINYGIIRNVNFRSSVTTNFGNSVSNFGFITGENKTSGQIYNITSQNTFLYIDMEFIELNIGLIDGTNHGTIRNVNAKANITIIYDLTNNNPAIGYYARLNVGGLIGNNYGNLFYANFNGEIQTDEKSYHKITNLELIIGGLIAENFGDVLEFYVDATIISNAKQGTTVLAGIIAKHLNGQVANGWFNGEIRLTAPNIRENFDYDLLFAYIEVPNTTVFYSENIKIVENNIIKQVFSGTYSASESEILSILWQKARLSEKNWEFTEGSLPVVKMI